MKNVAQSIILLLIISFSAPPCVWSASPCDSIDRSLTKTTKTAWAAKIAKQLHAEKVDILASFRFERWSIIYVNSHQSDEAFLFYPQSPLNSHYVTLWAGAAAINEEHGIQAWTLKNAPGIPQSLASCFAWYVTTGRTK